MLRRVLLLTVLCAASSLAFAGTVVVQVQDNFFSPSSVNIIAGDTVQFVNAAGGNPHNVATTSGPTDFECGSTGCVEGGDATASSEWDASITLNDEGTIDYQCEVHGVTMSGSITVGPVPVELQSFDVD